MPRPQRVALHRLPREDLRQKYARLSPLRRGAAQHPQDITIQAILNKSEVLG